VKNYQFSTQKHLCLEAKLRAGAKGPAQPADAGPEQQGATPASQDACDFVVYTIF